MKNIQLFRRQFLLTKENNFSLKWEKVVIGDFNLFYHPELEYTYSQTEDIELHLLGVMYDWEIPSSSNQQILDKLVLTTTFDDFIDVQSKFAGQFVMIYKNRDKFLLFNDTCAQSEIYYDILFTTFGTQPKILSEVIELQLDKQDSAIKFFKSKSFLSKRLLIGQTTHAMNVKHLLPNHYIDIEEKKVKRFFPYSAIELISINHAAKKACEMIKGYIEAASYRSKLAMAVTAGYDSRVLFLASLDVNCKYFVYKHSNMNNQHHDIVIPQKLTKLYNKNFSVIPDVKCSQEKIDSNYEKSIDFPRIGTQSSQYYENHIYLNGNISEIARNYYGYHKFVSPEDLAFLNGYPNEKLVSEEYKKWLETSSEIFEKYGYNVLDMFYWEEKMGNWAAKAKTEASALGRNVFTPFCSRELLITLLSTQRKYRDSHHNKLYNKIIKNFSPEVSKIPINPCKKQKIIRLMKTLKIYNLYQHFQVKYRLLKI